MGTINRKTLPYFQMTETHLIVITDTSGQTLKIKVEGYQFAVGLAKMYVEHHPYNVLLSSVKIYNRNGDLMNTVYSPTYLST